MTDFSCYDIVMLGDVHLHQYLNKNKTIAYAGSLIQQKRDEDLLEHGTIEWDIVKKKSRFIKIKNDYGMIQLEIGSKKEDLLDIQKKYTKKYENIELPKNLDIKMVYKSIEGKSAFKCIYETIAKSHNIIKTTEITDTSKVSGIHLNNLQQLINDNVNIKTKSGSVKTKKDEINETNKVVQLNESDDSVRPIKIIDNDTVLKIMINHLINNNGLDSNSATLVSIKKEINDILNEINLNLFNLTTCLFILKKMR
jgi:DNA repair exonuclease SbcCD nuclease subunit